jgi:hypothetical protein
MTCKKAIFLGALAVAATFSVPEARACGFLDYGSRLDVSKRAPKAAPVSPSDRIVAAEQGLDQERLTEAGAQVVLAFPKIRTTDVGSSPLETRAARILALALVRSVGTLANVTGFSAENERTINLEWSVAVLRLVSGARPNDPVAQADLGEAMSALSKYETEALGVLADLADRDLVGSAHAYAALARLRAARGQGSASRAALDRCEAMTSSPGMVCRVPGALLATRG